MRALRSALLALDVQKLDGSKRFGPCTYPHVEISSKFEVLGPRNGRGLAVWPDLVKTPQSYKVVFSGFPVVNSEKSRFIA